LNQPAAADDGIDESGGYCGGKDKCEAGKTAF